MQGLGLKEVGITGRFRVLGLGYSRKPAFEGFVSKT